MLGACPRLVDAGLLGCWDGEQLKSALYPEKRNWTDAGGALEVGGPTHHLEVCPPQRHALEASVPTDTSTSPPTDTSPHNLHATIPQESVHGVSVGLGGARLAPVLEDAGGVAVGREGGGGSRGREGGGEDRGRKGGGAAPRPHLDDSLDSHDHENGEAVVRGEDVRDKGGDDKLQRAKEGAEEGDGEKEKEEEGGQLACAKSSSISAQGQGSVVSKAPHPCAKKVKAADACGVKAADVGAKEERPPPPPQGGSVSGCHTKEEHFRAAPPPHLPPHMPHHLCNLDDLPGPDELLRYV